MATAHADDQSLTMYGITLYGTVDLGVAYQTHGTPLNDYFYPGLEYLVSKNSNKGVFSAAPSGLSQSKIGLRGDEELIDGLHGIFKVETGFNPTSGQLSDAPKSLTQNNGVALASQTSNADGSRAGQMFNSEAYAGFKQTRYGQLTYGRQNGLLTDNVNKYDPMGGSYAFSVIGYSGATAGSGDTQDTRLDNSLRYSNAIGPVRFAGQYQFGDKTGGGGGTAYEFGLGTGYRGLSVDATYVHKKDAIAASSLSASQVSALPALGLSEDNSLAATVSDNTAYSTMLMYDAGRPKFYAGYEYIRFANPTDPLLPGASDIGGYTLSAVNNTAYARNKHLQIIWTGAKYAFTPEFDLTGAWYHYTQNDYKISGTCSNTSAGQCSGQLNALSLMADYKFTKRFDVYGGAMWSQAVGGLGSGYLHNNTIDPMVGVRFIF
jgi:predicted porin